jgi:hypothetical protein
MVKACWRSPLIASATVTSMQAGKHASSGSANTIGAPMVTGWLKAAVRDPQGAKLMTADKSGPNPKSMQLSALVPLHGLAV